MVSEEKVPGSGTRQAFCNMTTLLSSGRLSCLHNSQDITVWGPLEMPSPGFLGHVHALDPLTGGQRLRAFSQNAILLSYNEIRAMTKGTNCFESYQILKTDL